MKPKSQERGQALILIVFAAVGLFAFTALAIDGSRVFSDRRHAQNAADTAVLAAALAKIRADPPETGDAVAETAGLARAASNGFDNTNSVVEVNNCAEPGLDPACEGLPADAVLSEYIQVVIRFTTQTTFARVIGRNEVSSMVSAVARVQGSSASGSSSSDAAMFATKSGPYDQCFRMNGGAGLGLHTHASGIYINCSGSEAISLGGSAYLQMDGEGQVVGCFVAVGAFTYDPIECSVTPRTIDASTFATVPTTQPPPACGPAAPYPVGNHYMPGSYSNITITSTSTMDPGIYCVSGSVIISGPLNGPATGRVQIVLQDQGITLTGSGATMDFSDLEIYGNNASVTLGGHSGMYADRLRYFSTGTGTFNVQGNAELTSSDAYFYLDGGNIDWNGDALLTLHGPPQGDPFGGLLIHKPWDNTSSVVLNGGTNTNLTGTFMVPGSPVTINGSTAFELHSQIIGSEFNVSGSAGIDIFYDPSENYTLPNSPTIQLTK